MKKKINKRAGSKKHQTKKQGKKKKPEQIITIEKNDVDKKGGVFTNWITLLSENSELF